MHFVFVSYPFVIEPGYDRDYLIILGCGIEKDGTPTNLLKGRIGKALEFAGKQKELLIIMSCL